jgi:hypothetical protein
MYQVSASRSHKNNILHFKYNIIVRVVTTFSQRRGSLLFVKRKWRVTREEKKKVHSISQRRRRIDNFRTRARNFLLYALPNLIRGHPSAPSKILLWCQTLCQKRLYVKTDDTFRGKLFGKPYIPVVIIIAVVDVVQVMVVLVILVRIVLIVVIVWKFSVFVGVQVILTPA